MRITCPNCGALYEIDATLIPSAGREVQCSACATTWFQGGQAGRATKGVQSRTVRRPTPPATDEPRTRDESPAEGAGSGGGVDAPPPHDGDRAEAAEEKPASSGTAEAVGEEPSPDGQDEPRPAVEDEDDRPAPAPPRCAPDERTLAILREERLREDRVRSEARQAEWEARASHPGTAAPADPRAAAAAERERMAAAAATARARRLDEAEAPGAPPPRPMRPMPADRGRLARRELLPDIEEINSSLRPDADRPDIRGALASDRAPRQRGGFAPAFAATLAVLMLPLVIYALAEPIGRAVPATQPALDAYAGWVDDARIGLDRWAGDLADAIAPTR